MAYKDKKKANAYNRTWMKNRMNGDPEYKKHRYAWRRENPEKIMVHKARARAKKNNLSFDIDHTDVIIPEFCPILGIKLEHAVGNKGAKDNSPTLDRIRTDRGYVKGNVWVISWRANRIKNDATLEELEHVVSALKKVLQ